MQSGLFLMEKGGKGLGDFPDRTYSMTYITVPVLLRYGRISDNPFIQPYAGAYFSHGIGGKIKDYNLEQVLRPFKDDVFKYFDAGIRVGASIRFFVMHFEVGCDYGLVNLSAQDAISARNISFFINVSVMK